MNLHHLELFHAIAVHGSLSHAAVESCTSQPSVSKQMKTFEESLGLRLFDRLPRGVRLTEAGELLELHAREIFARRDRAARELQDLSNLRRGRLSLASSKTIAAYLLPDLMARFMASHGGIETSAHVANTRQCVERVREGLAEFALVEGPVDAADMESRVFARDQLVVVCEESHPLASRRGPIPLERILAQPLIAREAGSGTREVMDLELARHGVRWIPRLELESTEAIKGFVVAGAGLGVLSRLAVARDLAAGSLRILRVKGVSFTRELSVVHAVGRSPSHAFRSFASLLPRFGGRALAAASPC
jgi:LysR family transcriptional regulator, transcriptional activator of the cysJI operon